MDELKVINLHVNFLVRKESEVEITLRVVLEVNVHYVRVHLLSHPSYVGDPYEVLDHLLHYYYFKLPYGDEQNYLVVFVNCVEVALVPL